MQTFSEQIARDIFVNECVIVNKKVNDINVIAKNRDRAYNPLITLVHDKVGDVERLYLYDEETDWSEGLNSAGVAVVNSALQVGRDEIEDKLATKPGMNNVDGEILREALSKNTVDKAAEVIKNFNNGLKGHTFIASADKLVAVEMTTLNNKVAKDMSDEDLVVRTNHGMFNQDSGYSDGIGYKSSAIRYSNTKKIIEQKATELADDFQANDVLVALRTSKFDKTSMLNAKRDNKLMWTSTQMLIDFEHNKLIIVAFKNKYEHINYENRLPANYSPKLNYEIIEI